MPPERGWNISEMFEAMERGELPGRYVLGENPLQSEADQERARHRLESVDFMVAQDIFLTATAEMADVRLPGRGRLVRIRRDRDKQRATGPARVRESPGSPPAGARDDVRILFDLARRMGHDWGEPDAETIWDEVRALCPAFAGMSYARLESAKGLQWPCYDEDHPGELYLHGRLWERPINGPKVAFQPVDHDPPVERLTDEFPLRLTTGRRLDEYNTGVQTSGYASPMRRGESLDISPEDAGSAADPAMRRWCVSSEAGEDRGAGADRRGAAARPDVHDAPLPGRDRHQYPDD